MAGGRKSESEADIPKALMSLLKISITPKYFSCLRKKQEQEVLPIAKDRKMRGRVPTFCKDLCLLSSHHFLHPAKLQVIVVAPGVTLDTLGYATDRGRCSCTSKDLVFIKL